MPPISVPQPHQQSNDIQEPIEKPLEAQPDETQPTDKKAYAHSERRPFEQPPLPQYSIEELLQGLPRDDASAAGFLIAQDRPLFKAKERKIPSSSTARAFQFGALGVSLIGGTISEAFKQKVGISTPHVTPSSSVAKYAINDKNAQRLGERLCKMRGAALKIGQILSSMEDELVPPVIKQALEKSRAEADIMPQWQAEQIMAEEFGSAWRDHFRDFKLHPFAAASIGQVHEAVLRDGTPVVLKLQYPGVKGSIDSDMNNFQRLIRVLNVFPRGLYLDDLIKYMRVELKEECDYELEATKQSAYRNNVNRYREYYAPEVI